MSMLCQHKVQKLKSSPLELEKPKELLLADELSQLKKPEEKVDILDFETHDDTTIMKRVAPAIARRIAGNKDTIIDALYPIMGGMISNMENKIKDAHMVVSMASATKDFIDDWIQHNDTKNEVQLLSHGNVTLYIESAGHIRDRKIVKKHSDATLINHLSLAMNYLDQRFKDERNSSVLRRIKIIF